MKKYLSPIVDNLVAPKPVFNKQILSPIRVLNRRKMMKECLKCWNYKALRELQRDIAITYQGLREGIHEKDQPLVLRNLSVQLFDRYMQEPQAFKIEGQISDIVVIDCVRSEDELKQAKWYHLYVKIKKYSTQNVYTLERKVVSDSFKEQSVGPRKWYFSEIDI